MPSLRSLAHIVLIPALLAGCSQSLFDARPGDNDGDGGGDEDRDGAPEPIVDARPGDTDGGMVIIPDGGGGIPDGGGTPPPDGRIGRDICPAPCIGDAFEEMVDAISGSQDKWRLVEVRPRVDPEYAPMTPVAEGNGLIAVYGTSDPPPKIHRCFSSSTAPPCPGLGDALALTTTNTTAHHPALQWIAPQAGRYLFTVNWHVAPEVSVAATTMVLARNTQSVVLDEQLVTLTPDGFEITQELAQGESVVLSAISDGATSMVVGVDFFVSGPLSQ
jgi:hypothetical protein